MRISGNWLAAATSRVLIPALIILSPPGANAAGPEGTIQIATEPAGADIFVDGQLKGVTPIVIGGLPPGDHHVRIVKDGFVENSQVVSVAPGAGATVSVNMTPTPSATAQAAPTLAAEAPSEGWSTKKKALAGAGAAAIIVGTIALLGGSDSADAPNAAPNAGAIDVTSTGQSLAGITTFSFTARGASDPESQPLNYSWNFGDGATGTGPTAAHVYNTGGTFTVALDVSDGSQSATTTTAVQVGDVSATWMSRFWEPWFTEGVMRKVRFTQSGTQLTGIYRTNLAPGMTGTVTGSLSAPRNITFRTQLIDGSGQDLGFTFTGTLSPDLTTFFGVADGYRLNHRRTGFGRLDE